jgi:SPP1 family predicted phage head-tail adaptor
MAIIAPRTNVAARPHRVTLQNPGPAVPDGDGGYTNSWIDLVPPALNVEIKPATAADLEHVAAGTVLSKATSIITGPFHPQVTTKTRLVFNGRIFNVTGDQNIEERNGEMVLVCVEVVA